MSHFRFLPPPSFRPSRLAWGRHTQTVYRYFARARDAYRAVRHHVVLDDRDVIVLHDDRPPEWSKGDRIVVLVHGLCGCHGSSYMVRLASHLYRRGFRVLRMDMRGCGAGLMLARGVFHADRSSDLLAALKFVAAKCPTSPITVCGFSLGANLTLKMLGSAREQLPRQLDSALVVEPPIDLYQCARLLPRGLGSLYDRFFARLLWRDFSRRRTLLAGNERLAVAQAPRTLWAFDETVTAPLAGFDSAEAYYHSASAANVLSKISTPTVILTAADDPIVPVSIYESANFSASTQFFVTDRGGHLGFLSQADAQTPDRHWMARRLADWIDQRDRHCGQADQQANPPNYSTVGAASANGC